jgi:hypothetical protein
VTTITAAVQKPSPKHEREVAPSHAEDDVQKPPAAEPNSRFGAVMRAVSKPAAAPRSGTDAPEADDPDRASGGGEGADADSEAGLLVPPGPSDATALLATILSAALATASPGSGTANGTSSAVSIPDTSRSGAQGVPMATGTGATAAPAGSSAESGPGPDFGVTGNVAVGVAPPSGSGLGGPPNISVLDRAVHFKPVRPVTAQHVPTLPASPATAPSGTADTATPSDQTGLSELIAPRLQPARPGGADGIADTSQPGLAGLPNQHIAAAAIGEPRLQTEPETRTADAAARPAAAGLDKGDIAAREDSRALFGIAKTILEATDRRTRDGSPSAGTQDRSGTGPGLPAASLPTIAAAIKDEIDRAASAAPTGSETRVAGDPAVTATPDGPLRTLRIQLRPEDLGTVTVELRLANGQLETHLRASRPETAALLHRDAAILTDLLKQAHYQAAVTVSQSRPAESGNWAGGAPSQGQPSFADGGARPGQGGDRQRQAEQPLPADRRDGERSDETVRPRDGGVYL